jgi:hypothetical protein
MLPILRTRRDAQTRSGWIGPAIGDSVQHFGRQVYKLSASRANIDNPSEQYRPQFSLVQVGDVAIGIDVFQIGEKCAVRETCSTSPRIFRASTSFPIKALTPAKVT